MAQVQVENLDLLEICKQRVFWEWDQAMICYTGVSIDKIAIVGEVGLAVLANCSKLPHLRRWRVVKLVTGV